MGLAGLFGVAGVVRPSPARWSASLRSVQLPVAYWLNASCMRGARSGSSSTVRVSLPCSSRPRTLR